MLSNLSQLLFQGPCKVLMGLCLAIGTLSATTGPITKETLSKYAGSSKTMDVARKLFDENRLPESEKELNKCIGMISEHHEANFFLSHICYRRNEFQKALAHIQIAIQSLGKLEDHYLEVAAKRKKAIENRKFELQHTVDSYGSETHNCMTALVNTAKESISGLEESTKNNIDPKEVFSVPAEYFFTHGNCLFRLGHLEAASEQYQKAIKIDPQHSGAWNNLVSILLAQKKFDRASEELAHAEAQRVLIQPKLKTAVMSSPVPNQ